MLVSRSPRQPLVLSSSQRRQRQTISTGAEASSKGVESGKTPTVAQYATSIVAKAGPPGTNHLPINSAPFLSIGTTKLIDVGTITGRPTLQRRRSSRSSNLSLTSIGENEELWASDDDDGEATRVVASSATRAGALDKEGSSGRLSSSTFGRRSSTPNVTKSSSAPSLFLRRHSSSSILDISSTSSVSTMSSTTNKDLNKKNFEARLREIDEVGPNTKISSSKFERRLSESDDFIRVEERANRYNVLMKKKEMARRNSLRLDDSSDQRVDTSVMNKRDSFPLSPSLSSPNQQSGTAKHPNRIVSRRLSMPISIIESDDDNILAGLEDRGVLNIQTAGVGPSSIYMYHNRRASM